MIKHLLFLTAILIGCGTHNDSNKNSFNKLGISVSQENQLKAEWILDCIDSSKLIFRNGRSIETKLNYLDFIGQITVENKDPYLIFSGIDCSDCDANPSMYIYSPSDGKLIVGAGKNTYSLPGRKYSFMGDSLIYEARVFYGEVLENRKGVIWFQEQLMKTGKWESSVFFAEITQNNLNVKFMEDTTGLLKQTFSMLQKKLCKEIK